MKVLIVDDDAAMRRLVQRVLTDKFGVTVIEADDGVAGLEYLTRDAADLVVLDLSMRVIGGLEMLETIRRSPQHKTLPVVLVTGNADEAGVRQAIRLGVSEVVAKPFTIANLRERFARVFAGLQQQQHGAAAAGQRLIELDESDTALIADSSPEYRAVVAAELSRLCRVEEVPNEFSALSRAMAGGLRLMVVGAVSRLSSIEEFGRKLRSLNQLRNLQLLAAVGDVDGASLAGVYDGCVARSFIQETFRSSLEKVLSPQALGAVLLQPPSSCLTEFGEHARDVFARHLATAVNIGPDPVHDATDSRAVHAAIELQTDQRAWDVRLKCTTPTALTLASALLGRPQDEISTSSTSEAIGRIAVDLVTELQRRVSGHGLDTRAMTPRVTIDDDAERFPAGDRAWRCYFSESNRPLAALTIARLRTERVAKSS